jgi:hypothetical protein
MICDGREYVKTILTACGIVLNSLKFGAENEKIVCEHPVITETIVA